MKPIIALFANLVCLPVLAQRDYTLVEQRNAWLTSGNAAALTTLADSSIARASLAYAHEGGALRTLSQGRRTDVFGADVRSYYRLTPEVVAYGSMTYRNETGSRMSGSMFMPTAELMPFDLVDDSTATAGDKKTETFSASGAIGWQALPTLALGARADFTAGTYAKHRDLRHSNTLMDLTARINGMLTLTGDAAVGAGFVYRRRTETMLFETYGTTDRIYTTLVDYANHQGEVETFGVEGFTDDSSEQPLLSEYFGATAQGRWRSLFLDATYMHRSGYYGRRSQYSASHEQHHGDALTLHLRCDLQRTEARLMWIDLRMATEKLTAERENYRRTTATGGGAATYYEYYDPTKMSDKTQTAGTAMVNAYWQPSGELFLWNVAGGLNYWTRRQTAYIYPDTYTTSRHILAPFAEARRRFVLRSTALLSAQAGCTVLTGCTEQVAAHAAIAYEMPLRGTKVRPELSLRYDFRTATSGDCKGLTRNTLTVAAAATF